MADRIHSDLCQDAGEQCARLFRETGQEKLRLNAALDGMQIDPRPEYLSYLRRRVRPALTFLLDTGREREIVELYQQEVFTARDLELARKLALEQGRNGAWLYLTARGSAPTDVVAGERLLRQARADIYRIFPALDGTLAGLVFHESTELETIAVDGEAIIYNKVWISEQDPKRICRGMLHMLLHCLYMHFLIPENDPAAATCDREVEEIIEAECHKDPAVRALLGEAGPENFDDHGIWYRKTSKDREVLARKWSRIQSTTGEGIGGNFGHMGIGSQGGSDSDKLSGIRKSEHDYRRFLERFAVWGEEIEPDPENFDYVYYHYGMEHYGNIPLMEPLEYREGHRLEQLVIAIDTSGSCDLATVRRFLEESRAILEGRGRLFRGMQVCFIQCDSFLQDVRMIRSRQEWDSYIRELEIKGRGGTDFRPVFRWVQEQREHGELRDPRGIIFFTDGDGVYPTSPQEVPTAFVFTKITRAWEQVPGWAKKLLV